MNSIHDKILGMLVGNALGDALGAPFEFRRNKEKLVNFNGKIELPLTIQSRFQGTKKGVIGSTTDDNQMTLALADVIVKGYTKEKAIWNYMEFTKTCTFLGRNTRQLFKGIKTLKGYYTRFDKNFAGISDEEITQSNGFLMRGSPLVVFKNKHNAQIDASLSNPGTYNKQISKIYHKVLRKAIIDEEYDFNLPNENWKVLITDKSKGWAWIPLYLIKKVKNKNFQEGLEYVITRGGDTDTNGAIVGAYLGAKFGFSKMMEDPITKKNWKIVKGTDNQQGAFYCPDKLHPKRIKELAEKLSEIYEE